MGFCVFFRVIIDLIYRISFYTAHCLEVQNYGTDVRAWYFVKNLKLLKPAGYVMHQILTFKNLGSANVVYIRFVLISERVTYRLYVRHRCERPLERSRRRWMNNDRMDPGGGCVYVDWIGLDKVRFSWRAYVNAVMNIRVPLIALYSLYSFKPVRF